MPVPDFLNPSRIANPSTLKERILTGVNPLKTTQPTSLAGSILKGLNPLSPRNIIEALVGTAIAETTRPYVGDKAADTLSGFAGYVAGGPFTQTLTLGGSSPTGDPSDPYSNWKRLGYPSREAMIQKHEEVKQKRLRESSTRKVTDPGSTSIGVPTRGDIDAGSSVVWNPQTKSYEYSEGTIPSSTDKTDPVKTYKDFRRRAEELYAQNQQAAKAEEESSTPPPAPKLPPPAADPPTSELLTVLAKLRGRPGVLNKETGEFTQQPWSATEAERYATYRAPVSEEVVVSPSEEQVVEDLKAELLETALTGVGPSEGYESFQSQRLGDAIRQAQEDIIRRRVESGDLMYR